MVVKIKTNQEADSEYDVKGNAEMVITKIRSFGMPKNDLEKPMFMEVEKMLNNKDSTSSKGSDKGSDKK